MVPNPAIDVVYFSGWEGEPTRLTLRNALGQTLVELPTIWPGQAVHLSLAWHGIILAEFRLKGSTSQISLVVN